MLTSIQFQLFPNNLIIVFCQYKNSLDYKKLQLPITYCPFVPK